MKPLRTLLLALALMTVCTAPGCRGTPSVEVPDDPTVAVVSPELSWTVGIVESADSPPAVSAVLRELREGRHAGFDRMVFEFENGVIPGYQVEYVDRPVRRCSDGEPVPLPGDGYLRIRMQPARAHTSAGTPTIHRDERKYRLPVLQQAEMICDAGETLEWVLATAVPNGYRVIELSDPARLVIDIRHH